MPLGIRLIVDFAFKKSFGSPENVLALIVLLNAILRLRDRIEEVTILNPFSYQEFEDDKPLFQDTEQAHHRFHMVDLPSGRERNDAIEIHTVELSKYDIDEETIATKSKLHQWVFLLLRAQDYTEAELRRLLPDIEFQPVITSLQTIATRTKDRQMYDQREKTRRDYEWAMASSKQ